jgi:hypothetical protein
MGGEAMGIMDVFRKKWQHSNPEVRRNAVPTVKDARVLSHMARADSDPGVRAAAVGRVEDQTVLESAARTDSSPEVRASAARRLKNERVAQAVAKNDRSALVRAEATRSLASHTHLLSLATDDPDESVRSVAMDRLEKVKPGSTSELAQRGREPKVRRAALEREFDLDILLRAAQKDPDKATREAAKERLAYLIALLHEPPTPPRSRRDAGMLAGG